MHSMVSKQVSPRKSKVVQKSINKNVQKGIFTSFPGGIVRCDPSKFNMLLPFRASERKVQHVSNSSIFVKTSQLRLQKGQRTQAWCKEEIPSGINGTYRRQIPTRPATAAAAMDPMLNELPAPREGSTPEALGCAPVPRMAVLLWAGMEPPAEATVGYATSVLVLAYVDTLPLRVAVTVVSTRKTVIVL